MSAQASSAPATRHGLYPIRTLAAMTGVNPVTLRAWERRYGLLKPCRTAKGHRLYDDAHVELVRRIVALLNDGIPISRAAALLDAEAQGQHGQSGEHGWPTIIEQMRAAVTAFDSRALDGLYNQALALYPADVVMDRALVPLLDQVSEAWSARPGAIAEEHFLSVFLRHKLGARCHHQAGHGRGPAVVLACLPGERHDMGLLLFALLIASRGYRAVQLGADLPLAELDVVMDRTAAVAAVLSGSASRLTPALAAGLGALTGRRDEPVMVGGLVSEQDEVAVREAGAVALGRRLQPALRRFEVAVNQHA